MAVEIETKDCSALSDEELEAMASMGGTFDLPRLLPRPDRAPTPGFQFCHLGWGGREFPAISE
ncbi:MAG: hypothetical protein ACKOA6_04170 [Actinomycetota bacterium]